MYNNNVFVINSNEDTCFIFVIVSCSMRMAI